MKKVGLELKHVIGPKTGHSYEKDAKVEVNKLIDAIVEKGKVAVPQEFKFTTYTLRYNTGPGIEIYGLGKHWEPARVEGTRKGDSVTLKTENVTLIVIAFHNPKGELSIVIDGTQFAIPLGDKRLTRAPITLSRVEGKWERGVRLQGVRKSPGLQGPIDDAFMSAFLNVSPTGKPLNEKVGTWAAKEMKHASDHWRKQFRGDAPTKKDTDITDADITHNNLVLWGCPQSNAVLAKIADKLPIKWTANGVQVGDTTYEAGTHVPVLIFPNPLNPSKYVVLNSGFTFREYDQLNNARQVPKLPDYAVIDVSVPANSRYPGKVVRAGFFGEKWELQKDDGK
jgi:hypothetical protein